MRKRNIRRSLIQNYAARMRAVKVRKNYRGESVKHWVETALDKSVDNWMEYMETFFTQQNEFSWENYGSFWHVDHVRPLATARSDEELKSLLLWMNTQPLQRWDNIFKGRHEQLPARSPSLCPKWMFTAKRFG